MFYTPNMKILSLDGIPKLAKFSQATTQSQLLQRHSKARTLGVTYLQKKVMT